MDYSGTIWCGCNLVIWLRGVCLTSRTTLYEKILSPHSLSASSLIGINSANFFRARLHYQLNLLALGCVCIRLFRFPIPLPKSIYMVKALGRVVIRFVFPIESAVYVIHDVLVGDSMRLLLSLMHQDY